MVQLNRYTGENAGDVVGILMRKVQKVDRKKIRSTTGSWDIPAFIMRSKQLRKLRREIDKESVRSWMSRGRMFTGDKE